MRLQMPEPVPPQPNPEHRLSTKHPVPPYHGTEFSSDFASKAKTRAPFAT